jgi:hypothetical protein
MHLHQQSGDRKLKNGSGVGRLAAIEGDLRASHATADRKDSVRSSVLVVVTACPGAPRSSMDEFQCLGVVLDDTTRLHGRRSQEGSRALSLELTHCEALVILAENSGITQRRLAEVCHLDPAQVTRVLDLLEALG